MSCAHGAGSFARPCSGPSGARISCCGALEPAGRSWIAAWSRDCTSASREPRVGFGTSCRSPSRSSVVHVDALELLDLQRLMPATKHR